MLNIIYGIPGTQKSSLLYRQALDNLNDGGKSILVVPEQEAVDAERRIYEMTKDRSVLGLEVLNFDKLCETVFRKCGSLSLRYISDSTKKLILYKTLSDISPALSEYSGKYDDEAFIAEMLSQITELKYARVTPGQLAMAAKKISDDENTHSERLLRKLSDLSLIFTSFDTILSESAADPCDKLTKAAELIAAHNPFAGFKFYFDSFNGFTAQEYEIITSLLKHNIEVSVTLCNPGENNVNEVFLFTEQTEHELLRCAQASNAQVNKTVTDTKLTYTSSDIAHISKSFNLSQKVETVSGNKDVEIISCSDLFDECDTCSALIAESVRNGMRYRDISVAVRDTDKYKGMLDAALERYGIPFFFSDKADITEKSLIRFIFSAIAVCKNAPKYTDMITYLKCGLSSLSDFETDILENYISSWKVSGKIWYSENGFTMNPRGFSPLTADDAAKLENINSLRVKVVTGLEPFHMALKGCKCVRDYSKAVYDFLIEQPVREKLTVRAKEMERRGEYVLASEEAALWKSLCFALDELVATLGELECSTDEYTKLLHMILADTDIGTIPQSADVVTIGDAAMLRMGEAKHTFMLGCEEGAFPKSIQAPGLLSLEDRRTLAQFNIKDITFDPVIEASKELFHFYCAACSPMSRLTLMYSRLGLTSEETYPSSALLRVKAMFDGIEKNSTDLDMCLRISGADSFIEHVQQLKASVRQDELNSFISSDELLKQKYLSISKPILTVDEALSTDAVNSVFKGDLRLSQSQTDSYANCPFSFQCKYALKLSEKSSDSIQSNDLGVLVHSVLDDFLRNGSENYVINNELDRDKIYDDVHKTTSNRSKLLLAFTPEEKQARVSRMLERIADITATSAANLVEEFTQSGFSPSFFEFPISSSKEGGLLPIKLLLDDGSYVVLGGIADRVDTMVKGDKLYIRVADYKTGKRTFSLENIKVGLSLQLLIYLFSIWQNADDAFRRAVGAAPGCEVIPAAAEYVMTTPNGTDGTQDYDTLITSLSKAFKRSGIYLADSAIIEDMDKGFSGKFIPISKTMRSTKSAVLKSLDELNELKNEVSGILTEIGNGIKAGNAEIKPLEKSSTRKYGACEFCPMKPVCKNAGSFIADDTENFEDDDSDD